MRFQGTDTYIATEDLQMAVNAAVTLERPLLIKGEPGTGKTMVLPVPGSPLINRGRSSVTAALTAICKSSVAI